MAVCKFQLQFIDGLMLAKYIKALRKVGAIAASALTQRRPIFRKIRRRGIFFQVICAPWVST